MKIGFYAPPVEFANALFDEMKAKLAHTKWTRWQPGAPPPSTDVAGDGTGYLRADGAAA